MKSLLVPKAAAPSKRTGAGVIVLLVLSATAIFLAPSMMLPGYSWTSHFISEAAAQGVDGAWVARLGFLFFGFAVLWLAGSLRKQWARGAYLCHLALGVLMVSTAAFSHHSWLPYMPFDIFEDFLHSVTATGMGFAFSLGVLIRFVQRGRDGEAGRRFDAAALGAAVVLPLFGWLWPSYAGVAQRVMFLVAYVWYGNEALHVRGRPRQDREDTVPPGSIRGYI
jgi:hypothetical protein